MSRIRRERSPTATASREPRLLLAWVYGGRVALAATIYALAVAAGVARQDTGRAVAALLLAAVAFTAASFWQTHLRRRPPGHAFLYTQFLVDTLLVTSVVHLTGGRESILAPLYVLVIAAAGLLLPLLGGILVGILASVAYSAEIALSSLQAFDGAVLLQVALFTTVAIVTGYLGDRLRQTGAVLGEVETELRLLQLDTDDILGSLNTGILIVDGESKLAYLNPAAAELMSLVPQEWLGRPVLAKLDQIAPGMGAVISRSAQGRKPIARYSTEETQRGGKILGVSTTVMEPRGGELPTVTAIFQDITEGKRIEALRRRSERLEAVAELSASLAHEIKNPLASIRSAVEQLSGGRMEAEDREVLERLVIRESDRLSRLLTEFIDYARVRAQPSEEVDLSVLVRNAVELVRAHPDAEGRTLSYLSPEVPEMRLRGDEDLLHRALLNLVLNAAQWSGDGGQVEVALERVESDILSPDLGISSVARVRVSDSGPGVPAEAVEQIFSPFVTFRPGGTGLGLALVQRAVEAHGGAVYVDNNQAPHVGGATFFLYLPTSEAMANLATGSPA